MEQDIRFCKASDGVRIAYAATGEGYPLLFVHGWASHLEFWAKMPRVEEFVSQQARAALPLLPVRRQGLGPLRPRCD